MLSSEWCIEKAKEKTLASDLESALDYLKLYKIWRAREPSLLILRAYSGATQSGKVGVRP